MKQPGLLALMVREHPVHWKAGWHRHISEWKRHRISLVSALL